MANHRHRPIGGLYGLRPREPEIPEADLNLDYDWEWWHLVVLLVICGGLVITSPITVPLGLAVGIPLGFIRLAISAWLQMIAWLRRIQER